MSRLSTLGPMPQVHGGSERWPPPPMLIAQVGRGRRAAPRRLLVGRVEAPRPGRRACPRSVMYAADAPVSDVGREFHAVVRVPARDAEPPLTLKPMPLGSDERSLGLDPGLAAHLPEQDRCLDVGSPGPGSPGERHAPAAGLPADARDEVGGEVDLLSARQIGRGILERQGEAHRRLQRMRVPKQRLPEERDRVQPLEVDADRFGFRIRERRPGLTGDEPLCSGHECMALSA